MSGCIDSNPFFASARSATLFRGTTRHVPVPHCESVLRLCLSSRFEDERFQSRVAVDKRGKKADRKKGENLRRYYR